MSRSVRRTLRGAIIACSLAATTFTPTAAPAHHAGCFTYGEVAGLDEIRTCTYEALSDTNYVYVATPAAWEVWVVRPGEDGEPEQVTLLSGEGPTLDVEFHPEIGETVHVSMFTYSPPTPGGNPRGTFGVIGAGLEQAHP